VTSVFIIAHVRLHEEGLRRVLAGDGRLAIVGSAASLRDGLDRLRRLRVPPDAVLLDLDISEGLSAARTLTAELPSTPLIALAIADSDDAVIDWAESGVAGLVVRTESTDQLVHAVQTACRGETSCSPRVAAALLNGYARLAKERSVARPRLTPREHEIADLIDLGLSNKEIAARLRIEVPTVKNHVHHILEKLNASRRGQAAAMLRRDGRASPRGPG